MNFDFSNVEVETGNQYLTPGNYLVKVIEVTTGVSAQKQTPYVKVTVADKTNATCSREYYLSTTVKEGSTKSAFDVSAQEIIKLIAATNNIDITTEEGKAAAKATLAGVTTTESLAVKLSALTINKEFGIGLTGKWVNPTDTAKKPWVKAEFGPVVPASKFDTLRAYDPTKHIKGTAATTPATTTSNSNW